MNSHHTPASALSNLTSCQASEITIAQLVGQVYESAPATERSHLLEHLLRPLGILSLVAVADGIFAKLWFQCGRQDLQVRIEDAQNIRTSDVIALVDFVQQVSVEAVDGLAQVLTASPLMAGSGAAALLVTVLLHRARTRRAGTVEAGNQPPRATPTRELPRGAAEAAELRIL